MVKTDERGRYPASEGRPRADLRNPEIRRMVRDGEISLTESVNGAYSSKNSGLEYARKSFAYTESLLHYFDDEWFDFNGLRSETHSKANQSNSRRSPNSKLTPKRCTKCKREYHGVKESSSKDSVEYLDKSVFGTIRMEKKDCPGCL